jgi:hypothetical protein
MTIFNPQTHTLEEYLRVHDGHMAFPLFKGYKHYQMIWERGLFVPEESIVRVMHSKGRGDEHYLVLGAFEVRGLEHEYHGGKKGRHDVRKILTRTCPPWEAQHLKVISY